MRLEKCIQRGEIFFGMGECGLEVLAVEFPEGDERGGGQGLEQAAGADGVFRGVDQQHGDGDVLGRKPGERRGVAGSCTDFPSLPGRFQILILYPSEVTTESSMYSMPKSFGV